MHLGLGLGLTVIQGIDTTPGGAASVMLKEDGDAVLLESGDFILIE